MILKNTARASSLVVLEILSFILPPPPYQIPDPKANDSTASATEIHRHLHCNHATFQRRGSLRDVYHSALVVIDSMTAVDTFAIVVILLGDILCLASAVVYFLSTVDTKNFGPQE